MLQHILLIYVWCFFPTHEMYCFLLYFLYIYIYIYNWCEFYRIHSWILPLKSQTGTYGGMCKRSLINLKGEPRRHYINLWVWSYFLLFMFPIFQWTLNEDHMPLVSSYISESNLKIIGTPPWRQHFKNIYELW